MKSVWLVWGCNPTYDGDLTLLAVYATRERAEREKALLERAEVSRRRKMAPYFDDETGETPLPNLTRRERLAAHFDDGFEIERWQIK